MIRLKTQCLEIPVYINIIASLGKTFGCAVSAILVSMASSFLKSVYMLWERRKFNYLFDFIILKNYRVNIFKARAGLSLFCGLSLGRSSRRNASFSKQPSIVLLIRQTPFFGVIL